MHVHAGLVTPPRHGGVDPLLERRARRVGEKTREAARPVDVRFLTGDTAIVVSEDGIIFPGQDAVASERLVRATWVLVRRDGGWRIASYHNSPAS
jgi:uncharacterized protein (TIGR02246 family)